MLILSRRPGESIIIGNRDNQITIKVVDIKHGQGKIGIEADKNIPIHRDDIYKNLHERLLRTRHYENQLDLSNETTKEKNEEDIDNLT